MELDAKQKEKLVKANTLQDVIDVLKSCNYTVQLDRSYTGFKVGDVLKRKGKIQKGYENIRYLVCQDADAFLFLLNLKDCKAWKGKSKTKINQFGQVDHTQFLEISGGKLPTTFEKSTDYHIYKIIK